MITIRPLGTRELKQVLHLLERFSDKEFEYTALQKLRQLYIPIYRFNQLLPTQSQFLPAVYVAVSRRKVLGLIWLSRDGAKKNRWKIEQLILDPDEFSYDIGAQLVHYVINRYGAEGVQTFLALIDTGFEQALGLLKSCDFRLCTRLHTFVLDSVSTGNFSPEPIQQLREAVGSDCLKLQNLFHDSLVPEVRMSLEKVAADFGCSWFRHVLDRFRGMFFKRWVVEDTARDLLLASLEITTTNYEDYYIQAFVSPGWQEGYSSLIGFGLQQVLKSTSNAKVYLQVYDFHKIEMNILESYGFYRGPVIEVLVKDYWLPLKDTSHRVSSPILIFPGKTSPA